jgi:general secretion pathway protein G
VTLSLSATKSIRLHSKRQRGFTVLELVLACGILTILATSLVPVERIMIIRNREYELRRDLREMRDAIDRYNHEAGHNFMPVAAGSEGYPPDLEALVKGVTLGAAVNKIRFLRRIPVDPMTGKQDWGLRCVQDDKDSTGWCGQNVFDVYSKSEATALDGSKYSDW